MDSVNPFIKAQGSVPEGMPLSTMQEIVDSLVWPHKRWNWNVHAHAGSPRGVWTLEGMVVMFYKENP